MSFAWGSKRIQSALPTVGIAVVTSEAPASRLKVYRNAANLEPQPFPMTPRKERLGPCEAAPIRSTLRIQGPAASARSYAIGLVGKD